MPVFCDGFAMIYRMILDIDSASVCGVPPSLLGESISPRSPARLPKGYMKCRMNASVRLHVLTLLYLSYESEAFLF